MKKRIMTVLVASAVAIGTAVVASPIIYAADTAKSDARPFSLPSERIEARLAYEKTALKITSAQQKQWDAYADGLRKEATQLDDVIKQHREAKQDKAQDKLSSVDRLQKRKTFLDAEESNLDNKIALYKVLTPDQQQVADEVLGGGFGGGFGKGGPGPRHGGGDCEHGGEHDGFGKHGDGEHGPHDWKDVPPPPSGNN